MKILYKTSNHKAQIKLDFSLVTPSTNPTEKSAVEPQDCVKTPFLLEKDVFIAKRIEEGDSPIKALEEWLIVEKNRSKK